MPAKSVEEKLRPCANPACETITRPARMQPLASIVTKPRQGWGLCTKCYSARRAEEAAAKAALEAATPKPATGLTEEQRLAHTLAGLRRYQAGRMARRQRVSA